MNDNVVYIRKYKPEEGEFTVNDREIWRYSGYIHPGITVDEELEKKLLEVKTELSHSFSYQVCYRRINWMGENVENILPSFITSDDLKKCLKDSEEVVLFAATVGHEIDRAIRKATITSPVKALLMQAYGAERVECLCDVFCKEIAEEIKTEGLFCTPRFSPGYGDLPLEAQKDVFAILDCTKNIGISLGDNLLMTPSKSVTAVFGLRKDTK